MQQKIKLDQCHIESLSQEDLIKNGGGKFWELLLEDVIDAITDWDGYKQRIINAYNNGYRLAMGK